MFQIKRAHAFIFPKKFCVCVERITINVANITMYLNCFHFVFSSCKRQSVVNILMKGTDAFPRPVFNTTLLSLLKIGPNIFKMVVMMVENRLPLTAT